LTSPPETLSSNSRSLRYDNSNHIPDAALADLKGIGASEIVAGFAKGARIVKAFNSIVTARFNEGPIKGNGRRVIFVSGDHDEPKAFVKDLITKFGFVAIDLGGLVAGGRMQQAGGPLAGLDLFVAA
jgi:8-hydroxy-5-deazaflavin:NADPH oxidoreductase